MTRYADTAHLRVAFDTDGPETGPPVLLLHGWPDDPHAWTAVRKALVEKGFRTITPALRGFGETRFLEQTTPRTAEPSALASDAVELLDALGIRKAIVVGHDWGARAGYALAALWPARVERLVACSVAYQTGVTPGDQLDYAQQRAYWYQWFFASERGREALEGNREKLCHDLWRMWSPSWAFAETDFEQAARAWENPDWVEITLHSYRLRWGNTVGSAHYADLEARLKKQPKIDASTVHLHGTEDGATLVSALPDNAASFSTGYRRVLLPGVGHFVPREQPEAVVAAVTGDFLAG